MPNLGRESKVPLRGLHTPLLPSLTSHPSSLTFPSDTCNTEATCDLWTPRVLIGCVRCCKGDSSLSLPVYPSAPSSLVVVVLCSCSPGLSCGVLVLVLISQHGQVQTDLPASSCSRQHGSWLDVKKRFKVMVTGRWFGFGNDEYLYKWQIPMHIAPLPVMQGITH